MSDTIKLPKCTVNRIIEICSAYNNDAGELINILHKSQEELGYLPEEVQQVIAQQLNIAVSKVYGVVSFYTFFTMKPKGRHPISICMGTACYVRDAEKVVDEVKTQLGINVGESTTNGKFSLDTLRCVGACGLAPVMMVGDKVYGHMDAEKVKQILKSFEQE